MLKAKNKKFYDDFSEKYYYSRKNEKSSSYFYNELLEFPTTIKLLGNIKGKKILDIGCGPGVHAKKMYEMGAKVEGIDISNKMIEIAMREVPEVKFTVGDVEKLPYVKNKFDIVVASLVIGHFENWEKALSEIRRVLKKNGFFIFSLHNPITNKFALRRKLLGRYRELKGYFEEGIKKTTWKKDNRILSNVEHYHKTYGTIIRTLVKNGFEIIDYEDCKPLASSKKNFPKKYKRALNYPHFCAFKVKKQ